MKQYFPASSLNIREIKINYVLANYLDYQTTNRFNLLTLIMCDYCALSQAKKNNALKILFTIEARRFSVARCVFFEQL
jgi:hypothetical protein